MGKYLPTCLEGYKHRNIHFGTFKIVGKFYSDPLLFTVVVCHTEIFNYTSDILAIELLLKQTATFV